MNDLYKLTIKQAAKKLTSGEIKAIDLVNSCLARIEEKDGDINAFITVTAQTAREQARKIDERRASGESLGPLAGIPYSIKDVFLTTGIETTAGSKVLSGYKAQYDATVYERLQEAGAVLVGKTNCDPFGFGGSTEHSGYGMTKNPIDPERVPGGSSGGAAAAVAYGGGLFAIAEDTGGSIRCPAAFCGITGLKPTYGLVSRYGSIAYASSFDCVGPITKDVQDLGIVLQAIAGNDSKDATSTLMKNEDLEDYLDNLEEKIEGKVIGIPKEYFNESLNEDIRKVVMDGVEKLKELGCEVREISLPNFEYALAVYYVVGLSEASSNLARYDGIRYGLDIDKTNDWNDLVVKTRSQGFGPEEKRRIILGTFALSSGYSDQYYKRAEKVRELFRRDYERAFEEVDFVITPTMPILPYKFGEKSWNPLDMWLADTYTVTVNPIGLPALSVKAGEIDNLPVGMQIIGKHFDEKGILNIGHLFEKSIN